MLLKLTKWNFPMWFASTESDVRRARDIQNPFFFSIVDSCACFGFGDVELYAEIESLSFLAGKRAFCC